MEGNRFSPPNFEKSSSDLDGSTETKKTSKKKKSAEAHQPEPEVKEKHQAERKSFADHFKAAVGEKMIDDKVEPSEQNKKLEKKPVAAEDRTELGTAEAEESSEEGDIEVSAENNDALAEIKPEEASEVDQRLIEGNIEALHDEIAATDDEVDIVAAQAAIETLENLPPSDLEVQPEEYKEELESIVAPEDTLPIAEDEPRPFEAEENIPLSSPTTTTSSGKGRPSGGGTPPPPVSPSARFMPAPGAVPGRLVGSMNTQPSQSEELYSSADVAMYERRAAGRGLLVGAVVGYLIGRRRGRIKTEKRMNVVVGKLEKQVEAKQRIIDEQVEAAKQHARQEYWLKKGVKAETLAATRVERPQQQLRDRPTAIRQERPAAIMRSERLEARPQQSEKPGPNIELRDEDVRRISETIKVGETNLRKIFEAKLVSPNGLRRIVAEHLQGKDIRRGLAREFMAKELSFERDPRFRDVLPQELAARGTAAGAVANSVDLTTPLQQPISEDSKPVDAPITKIPVKKPHRATVSTGALAILTIIALGLAAYAVVLGLTR